MVELKDYINYFALEKIKLDACKKRVEEYNKKIKEIMTNDNLSVAESEDYVCKKIVSTRESLNEDKLLKILKENGIDGAIKTKEYVDLDVLESMLYSNELDSDMTSKINQCFSTKEVVSLRISDKKEV